MAQRPWECEAGSQNKGVLHVPITEQNIQAPFDFLTSSWKNKGINKHLLAQGDKLYL